MTASVTDLLNLKSFSDFQEFGVVISSAEGYESFLESIMESGLRFPKAAKLTKRTLKSKTRTADELSLYLLIVSSLPKREQFAIMLQLLSTLCPAVERRVSDVIEQTIC